MEFLDLIVLYDKNIEGVFYIHYGYYDYLNSLLNTLGKKYVNSETKKNYALFLEYLEFLCNLSNLNSNLYFRYKDNYLEYLLTDIKQNRSKDVTLLINTINNIKCEKFIVNLVDNSMISVNPDMVYKTKPIKLLYNERN